MTMPSRRAALLAVIAVLMLLPAGPRVSAQGGESESQPGTTIHIVQRDENLFRIAMRYGTTVEAISAANGISDPRTIAVGQRLLIPNAQADAPGALVTHIVQPGDTCLTLARQYQTTPAALASANGIINPALLYVGQELRIAQGAATDAPAAGDLFIRAAAGDNLLRIAARYGITLNALLEANNLTLPRPLFPGQPLWIPRPSPASPADLPAPFSAVRVPRCRRSGANRRASGQHRRPGDDHRHIPGPGSVLLQRRTHAAHRPDRHRPLHHAGRLPPVA